MQQSPILQEARLYASQRRVSICLAFTLTASSMNTQSTNLRSQRYALQMSCRGCICDALITSDLLHLACRRTVPPPHLLACTVSRCHVDLQRRCLLCPSKSFSSPLDMPTQKLTNACSLIQPGRQACARACPAPATNLSTFGLAALAQTIPATLSCLPLSFCLTCKA